MPWVTQLQNLLTTTFVVASMLGMGLALTPRQILRPLRNVRLVALALLVNFVIVPGAAFLLSRIPSDPQLRIGIIVLGAVAGAPFLLKLADLAEGDVAFAVGLLVLLVVGTVVYLPVALPLALPGVTVDAIGILGQLSGQMLLPLAFGLFAQRRYETEARAVLPTVQAIANVALVLLIALMVTSNLADVIGMFGSGAITAVVGVLGIGMISGWLLGGPSRAQRTTLALGSGHRNYAAAFVVASGSFAEQSEVLVLLAAAALINMLMSFVLAGELRRRSGVPLGAEAPA